MNYKVDQQLNKAKVLVLSLIGTYVFVHCFTLLTGIGETDQARLINSAVYWHYAGDANTAYFKASPLFIHFIKKLIDWGRPISSIPLCLNMINSLCGALILWFLYILWKNLTNPIVALHAVILVFFCPSFFVSTNYGMPHIPAFLAFVISLILFDASLSKVKLSRNLYVAGASAFFTIMCCLKADFILLGSSFIGLAVYRKRLNISNAIISCMIAPLAFLIIIGYSRYFAPAQIATTTYAGNWFAMFPFTYRGVIQKDQFYISVKAIGPALHLFGIFAAGYLLIGRRRNPRLVVFAICWAVPIAAWWVFRDRNSGRHMMAPFLIVPLLVASSLFINAHYKAWKSALLLGTVIINYFSFAAEGGTDSPSTRLISSAKLIQKNTDYLEVATKNFILSDSAKKAALGSWTSEYALYYSNATAVSTTFSDFYNYQLSMPWNIEPRVQNYSMIHTGNASEAQEKAELLRSQGYTVYSLEYVLK